MPSALPPSDASVYARQLIRKRHGYPLWCPEPYGSSPVYVATGVSIGDVGYVTDDGAFETLFNICSDAENPLNRKGVPEAFVKLDIPEDSINNITNFHGINSKIVNEVDKERSVGAGVSTTNTMCVVHLCDVSV